MSASKGKRERVEKKEEEEEEEQIVGNDDDEEEVSGNSAGKNKKKQKVAEDAVFDLTSKRKVTVSVFKGKVLVNIREFYEDKVTGEEKPGSKGIALNVEQWDRLNSQSDDIDGAVRLASDKDKVFPIGDKRKATVSIFKNKVLVNIREFYEDKATGEEKPGSKGIALNHDQWLRLKGLIHQIDAAVKDRA